MVQVQIDHQTPGDTKRVTIFGSSREAVMAAKGQVEQIVTSDDAGAGGAAHSVECPQVNIQSMFSPWQSEKNVCKLPGRSVVTFALQ